VGQVCKGFSTHGLIKLTYTYGVCAIKLFTPLKLKWLSL